MESTRAPITIDTVDAALLEPPGHLAEEALRARARAARALFDSRNGDRFLQKLIALVLQDQVVTQLRSRSDDPASHARLAAELRELGRFHLGTEHTIRSQSVDEAIRVLEEARDLCPPTDLAERCSILRLLAQAYREWTGADSLAHAHALAENAWREANALTPATAADMVTYGRSALHDETLDDAVLARGPAAVVPRIQSHQTILNEVVSAKDDPLRWAEWAGGFGKLVWALSLVQPLDVDFAFFAFDEALKRSTDDRVLHRAIARAHGTLAHARGEWARSLAAHEAVLDDSDALLAEIGTRAARAQVLEVERGVALAAAYASLRLGDRSHAVVLAERGRARTWLEDQRVIEALHEPEARAHHADLEVAHERVRDLERRLVERGAAAPTTELARVLGRLADMSSADPRPIGVRLTNYDAAAERAWRVEQAKIGLELRAARRDLDALLGRLPRLLPPKLSIDDVKMVASSVGRPIVYLFGTTWGAAALGVFPDGTLDGLDLSALTSDVTRRLVADRDVDRTATALGALLVEPIAEWLGDRGRSPVIVALGTLGQLPLVVPFVEAGFSPSFIPSARALLMAHRVRERARGDTAAVVAIGDPGAVGMTPLALAAVEVAALAALAQGSATVIAREGATKESILASLGRCTHVHYSGHATFRPSSPLESCLHLNREELLTVRDVMWSSARSGKLDLVVLSACQSGAAEGLRTPEEVIGFPAALLAAGAGAVIGTTWKVDDLVATLMTFDAYRRMFEAGAPVHVALAEAQQWMRSADVAKVDAVVEDLQRRIAPEESRVHRLLRDLRRELQSLPPGDEPFASRAGWGAFFHAGA